MENACGVDTGVTIGLFWGGGAENVYGVDTVVD